MGGQMVAAAISAFRPRRYQLLLPLRVWIRGWGRGKEAIEEKPPVEEETTTENISSAGCYFEISGEPAVGSRVELEITMPPEVVGRAGSKVICRGRVVRIDKGRGGGKFGVGCAFDRYRLVPASQRS